MLKKYWIEKFIRGVKIIINEAIAANDAFLALYDDGSHSYLAEVVFGNAVANNAKPAEADLTVTELVKWTGVTDCTTITVENFDFH